MAGGLAILLGTLLGISFPMGGQNAQAPAGSGRRASQVLPANINVNSTAAGNAPADSNRSNVAQNNTNNDSTTIEENQDTNTTDSPSTGANQDSEPIRALW
jgi:hypothetical protein